MKATDLLKEQHQEIDELFERISLGENADILALRSELAATLVGHSLIEIELFYPATKEALGASYQLQTFEEEHSLVDVALQKLLMTDPSDESFHARVGVLKELVQRHVEEEERDLLKQAESAMDAEQLEELGSTMEARFEELRQGDVEALLSERIAKSMPAATRGAPERQTRKGAAKRPTAKRPAAKRASQRAEPTRGAAAKGRRTAATTGRKKPSAAAPTKGGRTASPSSSSRKGSRPAKTSRSTRKGGRSSGASAR